MSSILVILGTLGCLILGYRFYAEKIAGLWQINPDRPTPAHVHYDGVDYVPSQNWLVLFGHHFSSIAGAGPIIGPVIAVSMWGWGPALLWVVLGSIFLGGIHDFGSLMISVREGGATIGDVAAKTISRKAKTILCVFTCLALTLVIAVFAYLGAKTFVSQPKIVLPSLGTIPVAVLVGLGLYRLQWNAALVTICGLTGLGCLIYAGSALPVKLPGQAAQTTWILILLVYCYIASILPVNYLLQPRDYLSSFLLMAGILLALAGILVSHPPIQGPVFIANKSPLGYLWPMMFITVACGANSGFHSLIASGTTSKQLANERHARRIGFGAMLVEGFLAAIVIVLIVGGLTRAEFRQHLAAKTDPVSLFGLGFGNMTAPFLGTWGTFIALTILNVFILTTLDSATRITRYITEEFTGLKNRYLSTLIIIMAGGGLALGKDSANNPLWQTIWPAFGASNQLVAALALMVISCWLLSRNKPVRYALIPAALMLTTSLAALGFQAVSYIRDKKLFLTGISLVLTVAAVYLTKEIFLTFRRHNLLSKR